MRTNSDGPSPFFYSIGLLCLFLGVTTLGVGACLIPLYLISAVTGEITFAMAGIQLGAFALVGTGLCGLGGLSMSLENIVRSAFKFIGNLATGFFKGVVLMPFKIIESLQQGFSRYNKKSSSHETAFEPQLTQTVHASPIKESPTGDSASESRFSNSPRGSTTTIPTVIQKEKPQSLGELEASPRSSDDEAQVDMRKRIQ